MFGCADFEAVKVGGNQLWLDIVVMSVLIVQKSEFATATLSVSPCLQLHGITIRYHTLSF